MKKPIIVERFADNGEHSHWELIDSVTGETLWFEDDIDENVNKINNKKHLCNCGKIAVWLYVSGSGFTNPFFCDDCVTSVDDEPCSCNYRYDKEPEGVENIDYKWIIKNQIYVDFDEKGRPYPCCEYSYNKEGFNIDEF